MEPLPLLSEIAPDHERKGLAASRASWVTPVIRFPQGTRTFRLARIAFRVLTRSGQCRDALATTSLCFDFKRNEANLSSWRWQMRKEIIGHRRTTEERHGHAEWLDLDSIAHLQITSEDPAFPIENALSTNPERNELGWRAASPGPQTITLLFDAPQHIRRIYLHFIEREVERSQEFVLRYSSEKERDREVVRQQWTFSPSGSVQEIEDYAVELDSVTKLDLVIDPDRGRGQRLATLNAFRLA